LNNRVRGIFSNYGDSLLNRHSPEERPDLPRKNVQESVEPEPRDQPILAMHVQVPHES